MFSDLPPIALAILGYLAVYALACIVFPYAHCRRCKGSGKRYSSGFRTFRLCHRCHNTGRRLRLGRVIWNLLRRNRHDAHH